MTIKISETEIGRLNRLIGQADKSVEEKFLQAVSKAGPELAEELRGSFVRQNCDFTGAVKTQLLKAS